MFHYYFEAKKSNQQTQPKEFYQEYIDTGRETISHTPVITPAEFEAMLHGSVIDMRRDFKNTTKKLTKLRLAKGHTAI